MCPEEGGAAGLGELRSWWEVPAIAHFCSLFRTAFRLPDFEIEVSGREERARWRTPRPFLSCPLGSSRALCGRERGARRDFAGSPQPGEGLGGGGTRRSRAGVRAGAARGSAGYAKCGRPGSGRSLVAAVPTRAFRGEAKRAARGRGESALLYEWDRAALLGLGQEAECVGRVRARAPCPGAIEAASQLLRAGTGCGLD